MTLASALPVPNQTARGIALMLLAVLMFTAMDAFVKVLVGGYPTMQVVWLRFALQFGMVLALLVIRGDLIATLRTSFPLLHLLRSACQFMTAALFFLSLRYISLVEAQALGDLSPVLITLGAALFLNERLDRTRIIGVLGATAGALLILRPGFGVFQPAALLPIGSAFSYAGYALITRRVGSRESPWTSMIYSSGFGTLAGGAIALSDWQPIAAPDMPLMLLVGLLGTLAQLFVVRAFSLAEASVVAPFAYLGIVCAAFWGLVLFGTLPDGWTLLGALVIAAAGLYVWQRETRAASRAA